MPFQEGQPSLTEYLSPGALKQTIKKKLFGGRYLRLWDYFTVLSFQYESGAILGRARQDKLSILGKMLVVPGADANRFVQLLQRTAKERLDKFKKEVGKEPDTFYNFIFDREFDRVLVSTFGLTLNELFLLSVKTKKDMVVKVSDHKVSLDIAWPEIQTYGAGGIGFGSFFPELTERMYKNAYENVDMDKWAEARKMGVDIPQKPDIVSLEEREEIVLQMVAAYTSEYYPELIDPLGLRVYLERAEGDE
jgi:hypothetical protein